VGYYTAYSVEIVPESESARQAIEDDLQLSYAIGESRDSCKWYDHEVQMRDFSREFPDHLFELNGEGEESYDIWRKYFKNGKMQSAPAIITFDPFDESKLR